MDSHMQNFDLSLQKQSSDQVLLYFVARLLHSLRSVEVTKGLKRLLNESLLEFA